MTRLRVLHCIYDDPSNPWLGGGGAHRVFELYRRLSNDLDVTVAAGAYPGARSGEREGVRYVYPGRPASYPVSRLSYGWSATGLLQRGGYDAAVFDFSVYTPIRVPRGRPVGHIVHMPIGTTARGRWGRVLGGLVAWRERRMLGRARRVQTTSRWMEARLRPLLPDGARVDVVRSGVEDAFFGVRRAEAGFLLCYGRLDYYQKGLDLVLDAYGTLRSSRSDAPPLVIAGRGDEARVAAAIAERGLAGVRIEAPVKRPRVLELLAGASALLMPSRFEGFPVVPIEAMAAGVPVVAAAVGGLAEIVEDGRNGLLIPSGDAAALATAAGRLLDSPALRERLSGAARESARRFRWERVAEEHRAWLEAVAAL